jgi:hypothetical protein
MQQSLTVVNRIGERGARRKCVVAHGTSVATFLQQISREENRSDLRWVFRAYQRLDDEDIVNKNYEQDQLLELFAHFPFRRGIRPSPAMFRLPVLHFRSAITNGCALS